MQVLQHQHRYGTQRSPWEPGDSGSATSSWGVSGSWSQGIMALRSPAGVALLVPQRCSLLAEARWAFCVLEESKHVTPTSIKVVTGCVACLRQNITGEGELKSYSKKRGVFSQKKCQLEIKWKKIKIEDFWLHYLSFECWLIKTRQSEWLDIPEQCFTVPLQIDTAGAPSPRQGIWSWAFCSGRHRGQPRWSLLRLTFACMWVLSCFGWPGITWGVALFLQLEWGVGFGREVLLSLFNVPWSSLRAQDLIQFGFN